MHNLDKLKEAFARPGRVEFLEMGEGLEVVQISNDAARAAVSLQGAQLLDYLSGDEAVIWLSSDARLRPGKSIRGGIPICWPWFGAHPGDPDLPTHGFARTVPWQLLRVDHISDSRTVLEFVMTHTPQTRRLSPQPLSARLTLSIGATLEVVLKTTNCGDESVTLSEALHTYFQVGDVRRVAVHGLDGCDYLDKVHGFERRRQQGAVRISGEVDRIYLDTAGRCEIRDPVLKRRIRLSASNSHSTVVWNPGAKKARQMGDLGPDGYRRMLCVETANAADNALTLRPGQMHALGLRIERLAY
ncbi:MAG: D-hexose-6-phosphate mutarotase [Pseudomonadota bacterium]